MAVDARILAAVMPAPRQPVEIREFPRPTFLRRARFFERARRSVRHRCPPLAWPSRRRAVSHHSRSRIGGNARGGPRDPRGPRRQHAPRRRPRGVLRRASHLRPLPRVYRAQDSDPLPVAARTGSPIRPAKACSEDGPRPSISNRCRRSPAARRRLVRRLHRRRLRAATAVHILDRAALRPGDSVLVQGAGAVGLSAVALARLGGAGLVAVIGAPSSRLQTARRMGADEIYDSRRPRPAIAATRYTHTPTAKGSTSSSRRPGRPGRSRKAWTWFVMADVT